MAETRVITVDAGRPEAEAIEQAAAALRAGKLVAFPTETVYGLGGSALDPSAVARIFDAKGRPASDPLIVHIAALEQLGGVALDVPEAALRLARRFWPGPLTLVLPRAPRIPPSVSAGRDTVAVRVPGHPVALALLASAGVPVAAPSANRFSRPSPTTARHVLDDLEGRIDVLLDAGPTAIGLESTVLDMTSATPAVLRPGGVPLEALREIVPGVSFAPRYLAAGEAAASPGTLLRHYAPDAALTLVAGPREAALAFMRDEARRRSAGGARVGILAPDEDAAELGGLPARVVAIGPEADPARIGAQLFARLRELDAQGVDVILARGIGRAGLGLAIWDRLVRAAEGRVVEVGL